MPRYKSFFPNPMAVPQSKEKAYEILSMVVTLKSDYECYGDSDENLVWLDAPNGDEIELDIWNGLSSIGISDEGYVKLSGAISVNSHKWKWYEIPCQQGYQLAIGSAFYFVNFLTKMERL